MKASTKPTPPPPSGGPVLTVRDHYVLAALGNERAMPFSDVALNAQYIERLADHLLEKRKS